MPNPKQPQRPKTTEEILREMEAMSKGAGSSPSEDTSASEADAEEHKEGGGALKSLLGFFVKVVPEEEEKRAGAVTAPPARPPQQSTPRTGPRVADLVAGEPAPKFKTPETQAGDLSSKPFGEIYNEAGLSDSPCSVEELAKLLENPAVANQPLSVKIIAVNLTLSAKGIGPDVPIADAVRRDRALDAYQRMLDERAHATEQRNAAKVQQITQETEEYLKRKQMEMEALRTEIAEAKRQSTDFSVRREAEEKRMVNLISPFLEGKPNPVTVGNQAESPSEG